MLLIQTLLPLWRARSQAGASGSTAPIRHLQSNTNKLTSALKKCVAPFRIHVLPLLHRRGWKQLKHVRVRNFIVTFLTKHARHTHEEGCNAMTEPAVGDGGQLALLQYLCNASLTVWIRVEECIIQQCVSATSHGSNNAQCSTRRSTPIVYCVWF